MSKKLMLVFAIVAVVSFTFTSCKSDKKEETKTEEKSEIASNEVFQCPMNCEDGKSYTESGSCPVCKMDLKAKSVDMDNKNHMNHDKNCTCKKDEGECKCAEGECKCITDDDSENDTEED